MGDQVFISTEDSVEESQTSEIIEKPPLPQDFVEQPQRSELLKQSSAESVKTSSRRVRPSSTTQNGATNVGTAKRKTGITDGTDSSSRGVKSTLTKSTFSSTSRISGTPPGPRRNSTGGLPEKQPTTVTKRPSATSVGSGTAKKSSSLATDPMRRSLPEIRKSTLPSTNARTTTRSSTSETRRSVPISPLTKTPRASVSSDASNQESVKKTSAKLSSPSLSSARRSASSSLDSTVSSVSTRKFTTKLSSSAARSPSVSTGSKAGSLSTSLDRSTSSSSRKKGGTLESRDSRLIMLPKVETKAGDDVRLDLRGHRIRSLNNGGLNLLPNLEFVYLRDNLLSVLDGIEILTRVKVLDLSFNDFKGPGFEPLENCKALQQLYLAGNQITSLISLPELPNLEFLSVAQNKLKSLSMASQPRLQVLAASKNKISTLKGFPYLPSLEHLRVEENPILKMRHLEAASILLVGPTLKKFNDKDLSREEVALAKRYPSHTPLCIRGGWEFCRPEQAVDSTFRFLLEQWKEQLPQGYLLKEAFIDQPFEEDACYCHFNFVKDEAENTDSDINLKYQWFIGERTPSNFTEIHGATRESYWPKHEDIGRILKVVCTPKLGETEYPTIFAISSPVSPGTGDPKVLKIEVCGDLLEGNIIRGHAEIAWCGGTPGKSISSWLRKRWNNSPVVIVGAEEEEYQLTLDDVDSCLVFMYTPMTEEGAKGEPQYAITDYVKAAPPSVSDVQISGDVVEGNIIRGVGNYFGGREGPSKFEWLREDKDTREFVLVSSGTNEYTLTKEDVGWCLAFVYIPVNFEGQEGKSLSIVSQKVKQAPPKVTNVKIIGELKEGSKITVAGIVTGGTEGASRVQWFKTSSSTFEGESCLDALSTSKIAKAFRIPLGAVGYYIVAKFTPMAPDGEAGESVYVISERSAETLPPSLNFLSLTGDYAEGGIMTASYGYIGGHEGKSIYSWYLHEVENDSGAIIPEFSGLLQYRITKDAIGKFISFKCTPVRDDGTVGEPRTCMGQERVRPGTPRLLSLRIAGTAVEGTALNVEKKYWGGEEGDSVYRWFRTSSSGTNLEVNDARTSSYKLSIGDIGFSIYVSCEPVRNDWARGPIVISEQVGPIVPGPPTCHSLEFQGSLVEGERVSFLASYSGGEKGECLHEWLRVNPDGVKDKISCGEFLDLTLEDVDKCIELIFTPIRKDALKGSSRSILSCQVAPGDPIGVELSIPECCEGETIVPKWRYFGGQEGDGEYVWYRSKNKLLESALLDLPCVIKDVHVCARTLTYKPLLEDVGAYLALYWLPIRIDGKSGNPLASVCESPVSPAFPVVSNVRVKELSSSIYLGEGEYFGGHEGSSLFSWYRETDEGTITLINGACSKTYEVVDEDYDCRLLFGYTPVRSDSVIGELRLSEPTHVILPDIPRIETLALTGKAVEGDILTAIEVIPKSESQERVWLKYKKDIKYTWFISTETGNNESFEPLQSHRSCSYRLRFEDIGHALRCECVVSDVFGRSSDPVYAETPSVSPGIPRMDKLEIEGRGFHTNLYAFRGVYSGGKEGKSRIQWLRSMVGSPDLISIPGETGRMYEANVDDVGYRLVVIYTPVREDGVEGHPVSASTDPISIEPDVLKEVKQKLEIGSVKFEALCDKDQSTKKVPGMGNLERRILEVNRKRVKVVKPGSKTSFPTTEVRGTYAPPFHVELFRNDQHRLRIVVDSDNEVDLLVQTRHLRDIVVLVIRGLAQRFNSTSLNSLLKIET
ncbi:187-kDa microtubule-associated protein AIR9 [Nicotiana tomentosiformis]|uniref:187-kDa microtubule-associated protein AIR9 n=1 Tax=Nicotiana tomentosiformis TaxID=4098 RepID=UPI00051B4CF1|nr:187-kDa microtubule-associated protein AIR9 isoform X1 [Nicotiana tomentosiformis]XP_009597941.1 187-kDa microtubule-associated protein AIR9 isoform X1 [Nicotiana tomentosiformis]XP_018625455.1 187-kDa microtubule-associated protein AIR9 isoform X1 [Nicotiana tomentosiformis]XP_018625460.1 187-kDa microtubule-associated protein AIR9 isoform X1 [Nicotiana tomentosiformis]